MAREISMMFWSREYCTASSLQQQQHVRRDTKSCAAPSMMSRVPAPRGDDLQGATTIVLNHLQRSSQNFTKTRVTTWSYFVLDLSRLTTISFWMIFVRLVVCMHARTWTIMLFFFFLFLLLLLQLLLQIVTRPLPSPPSSTASRRCSKQPKQDTKPPSKQASNQASREKRWTDPSNSFHLQSVCLYKYEEV